MAEYRRQAASVLKKEARDFPPLQVANKDNKKNQVMIVLQVGEHSMSFMMLKPPLDVEITKEFNHIHPIILAEKFAAYSKY